MSNRRVKSANVVVAVLFAASSLLLYNVQPASAAACTAPGTDYGTVTLSATVSQAGTYRIWTRMSAPNSTDNTYLLDIDSATCYTVGGSTVPTYASGATTYFQNNTTNWISKTSGGTTIDVALTAGSHTLKLIGASSGVVVDRVLIVSDTTCVPTGVGDNCASIYVAADIDQNGSVNFLDFSRLANKYGQSSASLGRADINNDGTVNFLDYSALASKYGQ